MEAITNRIQYIGVNDREKHRFESLWPLPYGVSYNSYLVRGSNKCAIIDSVAESGFRSLIEHLTSAGIGSPDYLVINHMEPDHSGSIPLLAERFPDMKIICGKPAAEMVGGFYGITDQERFIVIKDGDSVDLGGATLKFVTTPMVHWPETIMTYLVEEATLFSGDAFGCFGALNGTCRDDTIEDIDVYFNEMYRYYSNIVGKYGKHVQAAIKKTSGLSIERICPTHGPVWHKYITRTIDIYNRLSRYESEDGVVLVYATMYGNTSLLSEAIVEKLTELGVKKINVYNAAEAELSYMISDAFRYKTLIVGSPTYSMNLFPPVDAFVRALQIREIKDKIVATFGSYTWVPAAMPKLYDTFNDMNLTPVASITMKQGFDENDRENVSKFAETIVNAITNDSSL